MRATPFSLPRMRQRGGKWRLHICISGNDHRGVRTSEFPAESLYASEQEADIHGIAFGQRVVDGKVEALSVMDLKPKDRRATPMFRVQFRTTFSVSPNWKERESYWICLPADAASRAR